jgi:hypothetical protein
MEKIRKKKGIEILTKVYKKKPGLPFFPHKILASILFSLLVEEKLWRRDFEGEKKKRRRKKEEKGSLFLDFISLN